MSSNPGSFLKTLKSRKLVPEFESTMLFQANLINRMKATGEPVNLAGDGKFDSPGQIFFILSSFIYLNL